MPTTLFGPSLPVFIAAGGTRTILQGDPLPGGVIGDEYWGVFTVPQANAAGDNIEVVSTAAVVVQGVRRLRYTVRNNNPNQSVNFIRFSIQVTP
jgi:hypothetical protein